MIETEVLIIGGGITGLSLASFLDNKDYLILEKDSTPGGYCKTTIKGDYTWDYSGHFFHFKNPEIKEYILENVECDILKVEKITDIDYKRHIIDFPFQHNIHQLPKEEYEHCVEDLKKCDVIDTTTFKSYVKSILGDGICDKFVIPYNEKLYACDLNNLEYDSMGRFFPPAMKYEELAKENTSKSYNDTFIYPVKGSYEYVKSVLKRLDENKILLNTELIDIDVDNKIAKTNKGDIKFKHLISTLPFNKLLNIQNTPHNLSANKVAVFNLGFDKGTDIKTHWRYFPNNEVFYRVGFYNNILGQEKLSLYVEVGLKLSQSFNQETLLKQILNDLKECNIITDHKLIEHQFILMNPAYVHITKESKGLYDEWNIQNNPKNIYSIGRYGSWIYCSIEDNIIQAKETAEIINNTYL
jgi:protoporphyrinogen oxidase